MNQKYIKDYFLERAPCLYKSSLNIIYRALNVTVRKSDHFPFPCMDTLALLLSATSMK